MGRILSLDKNLSSTSMIISSVGTGFLKSSFSPWQWGHFIGLPWNLKYSKDFFHIGHRRQSMTAGIPGLMIDNGVNFFLGKEKAVGHAVIGKCIRRSKLTSVVHLHGFETEVAELVAAYNSPITKKPLAKLDSFYRDKLIIGTVFRDLKWEIAVGNTHIRAGEAVIVICTSMHLKDVRKLFVI